MRSGRAASAPARRGGVPLRAPPARPRSPASFAALRERVCPLRGRPASAALAARVQPSRPAARSRQRRSFWSTLSDLLMRDGTNVARAFGWNVSARGDAGSNAELIVDQEEGRRGELFGRVLLRRTRAREGGCRSLCDGRSDS